ncbi:MAG: succinate dehydrogenase cytochrome b subunit [Desulfuromonadales bacterium]|nr:succinate dehydrogenase cytochrome b subunit [Desulfuromonadales bacterium]
MQLFTSSIGRKILMAITGLFLVLFAVIHLIGNTTIFGWIPGGVNAYAHHLHAFPPMVWAFRAVMLVIAAVHIYFGIQLTVENRDCRQQQYAVKATQKTTFASENMIWTGLLLLVFIVYHLLHFTGKVIPGMELVVDAEGTVDVFAMIVAAFKNIFVAAIYAGAMATLFLHLSHGIQSLFQTFGLSNDKLLPTLVKAGTFVALVLFLGYVSVPLTIFLNILK